MKSASSRLTRCQAPISIGDAIQSISSLNGDLGIGLIDELHANRCLYKWLFNLCTL